MEAGTWRSHIAGGGVLVWLSLVPFQSIEAAVTSEPRGFPSISAIPASTVQGDTKSQRVSLVRVRTVKDGVFETASLLEHALRRSSTIRRLIAALEQTDLVVYIGLAPAVPNRSGRLAFIAANRSFRMFQISIDMRNHVDDQIKWLGHELAHALEVGQAPGVRSEAGLTEFYRRIGRRVDGGTEFETAGAEEVGRLVKAEIATRRF